MPRQKSKFPKTRLSLEMPSRVVERMERLMELTEAESRTEVIRRALAVYEFLAEQRADGAETIIRRPDGSENPLLLVPG